MSMKKTIAIAVLATFLPLATSGCFGTFQLTRKVYQFNRTVSPDKWVREIAFLVMIFVPIYGFASLFDAVLFNSVEFWTGSNPVLASDGASQTLETADGTAVLTRVDANTLDVRVTRSDGEASRFQVTREGDGFIAQSPAGELLAAR
jgi:Domain of unknown function (DUF3332)